MILIFALGFLAFALIGFQSANDASNYHNEVIGVAGNSIVGCMSILAMIGCILAFIFVELPMYGITIWSVIEIFK